jgi:hypothetical protein
MLIRMDICFETVENGHDSPEVACFSNLERLVVKAFLLLYT